jgi:hypothetical protein
MSATSTIFGFTNQAWEAAKREAVCAIVRAAQGERMITYSELARAITSIQVEPHDYAMDRLLDEISKEEDAAGRGILTALVVTKENSVPAEGFWGSARDIGRQYTDKDAMWAAEVDRIFQECKKKHPLCQ